MHTLVPANIKPHLVPFLFRELKPVSVLHENKVVIAAKVTNETPLGVSIRLLLEKSNQKPDCDTSGTIFLRVYEKPTVPKYLKGAFRYADGRSSFLFLPEAGQVFLNKYLEKSFETALMYHVHSWAQKNGEQGINEGIIIFLSEYDLEEYGATADSVRRDYYRKKNAGYFEGNVTVNPITLQLEPK